MSKTLKKIEILLQKFKREMMVAWVSGNGEDGGRWSDFRNVLVEPTRYSGASLSPRFLVQVTRNAAFPFAEMEKNAGGAGPKGRRESVSNLRHPISPPDGNAQ